MFATPLLRDLQARGLIASSTDPDALDEHLAEARGVYFGCDPTAPSLHIGNLAGLVTLRRFQLAGHRPILLVGGGTGLIGDPSGRVGERGLNPGEVVAEWTRRIRDQVAHIVRVGDGPTDAVLVDNFDWLSRLGAIDLLRDVGKHFPLSDMLRKESVQSRMGREGGGISYTEFSYMVLQAFDFLELFRRRSCTMQIGGSDQWGNITAGCELIRKVEGGSAHALVIPLVTKADGSKFGKTETGTIWLDAQMTSPYAMYQFWLNAADADVVSWLRIFTFLDLEEIAALEEATHTAPERREAQHRLAEEVTRLVHGEAGVEQAKRVTAALFGRDFRSLSEEELRGALESEPVIDVGGDEVGAVVLPELFVRAGLAPSLRKAEQLARDGGLRLNGEVVRDVNVTLSAETLLHGRYAVITSGRKHHRLVRVTPEGR